MIFSRIILCGSIAFTFFRINIEWKEREVFIHFDGCYSGLYVFVNGKKVGYSQGVFDGDTYNTTQNRMYDYDIDKDPLHDYIRVKTTSSRKGDIIAYHDSIYT